MNKDLTLDEAQSYLVDDTRVGGKRGAVARVVLAELDELRRELDAARTSEQLALQDAATARAEIENMFRTTNRETA